MATTASSTAAVRASITIADDGVWLGPVNGRLTASFLEDRSGDGLPAAQQDLGEGCFGIVSRPTPSSDVRGAQPEAFRASLDSEQLVLTDRGPGKWSWAGPALEERVVALAWLGGLFPEFEMSVPSVAALELDPSGLQANLSLAGLGALRWVPGEGDYVRIDLRPQFETPSPTLGGQVTCLVQDRGCFSLSPQASAFLLSSRADRYSMSIRRTRVIRAEVDEALVVAERSRVWRFELGVSVP